LSTFKALGISRFVGFRAALVRCNLFNGFESHCMIVILGFCRGSF
jgi:hypothetical protein